MIFALEYNMLIYRLISMYEADGYWLSWEDWTTCSELCGSGTRERTRTCIQPLNGGNACDGAEQQVEYCNTQECPCKQLQMIKCYK